MSQPQFSFCSFAQDLTDKILHEQPYEKTIFIFPNERSKKTAMLKFQQLWQFSDTRFITMEELKDQLFLSTRPLLREEKRTLAFFNALTQEDRKHFKISNYFQSIELANNCFKLWEEFNEECATENLQDILYSETMANTDWQIKTWQRLQAIKQQYRNHINRIGFDDPIFVYHRNNLNNAFLLQYERYIFANQFYYTNLEKYIIGHLTDLQKTTVIYYQLPEKLVNKENLEILPFKLYDLLPEMQTRTIKVFTCNNDFSTIVTLARQMEQNHPGQIVDSGFSRNPYSRFLSPATFDLGSMAAFTSTSVYRFFTALYQLVESLLWEPQEKKLLLPIQNLLNSVLCEDFFYYFIEESNPVGRKKIHEQTLIYLYNLIELDFKYTDLDMGFFSQVHPDPVLLYLKKIILFVQDFLEIKSIRALINKFDTAAGGIDLKKILSPDELRYTNIPEVFYAMLADFVSIEEIGIASDWDNYFPTANPFLIKLKTVCGLLRLFLDYMKPKKYLPAICNFERRTEITSLLDTRNLSFPAVAILNVIEGKIPQSRQTQFLFTDKQRRMLGLKTFEDVQLREKYYFFRLVLTSQLVYLFTQINNEKNIEVSSFIEELGLYFPSEKLTFINVRDLSYRPVYQHLVADNSYRVNSQLAYQPDFYRLPFNKQADFPSARLELTFTSFKDLDTNPVVFYIRHIAGLEEWQKKAANDFSPRLLGNLAHDVLNQMWQMLTMQGKALAGFGYSQEDQTLIRDAAFKILNRPRYYYSLLHDHTQIYFENILLPVLLAGIKGFCNFLQQIIPGQTELEILPEEEYSSDAERKYKTLISAQENALQIPVAIRGRADLRINISTGKHLIFDYKTGNYYKEQLLIYELFYYLLEEPLLEDSVESWFYQVIKNESKSLQELSKKTGKEELIGSFIANIKDALYKLVTHGYYLPAQKSKLDDLAEITRKDLYLTKSQESVNMEGN